jgi:hypothetical protein
VRVIEGKEPFSAQTNNESILFDKTGETLSGEAKHRVEHFAKKLVHNNGDEKSATYYVKTHQATLFDPNGPYGRRGRTLDTELKRVSKNTFDFYITYLKTNNSIYMTKAQRGFLND